MDDCCIRSSKVPQNIHSRSTPIHYNILWMKKSFICKSCGITWHRFKPLECNRYGRWTRENHPPKTLTHKFCDFVKRVFK